MLKSYELRKMWLEYFESKGHKVIPSASIIPENDPTVLFTTAGMHPLVPYLLGEKHPQGNRLTDVQKCIRTGDIDEVGDNTHLTFFEMLGNWSLGDYFKKEMIPFSFEFLTSEKYLDIDKSKLAVTVFAGDDDCPRDDESAGIWKECGLKEEQIFYLGKKHNWWGPAGITGPCGPDTEMFIDTGKEKCCDKCSPACDCGKYVEIWNDVFMQFNKQKDGSFIPLEKKNVDTGMGLERTICMLNGFNSVYDIDLFQKPIEKIEELSGKKYQDFTKPFRIIADHVRTAVFMLGDRNGITPSNVDQGYVLRRIIRRSVRFGRVIDLPSGSLKSLAEIYINLYKDVYSELVDNKEKILSELEKEEEKFQKTIQNGLKEFEKVSKFMKDGIFNGKTAFRLYDTFGFPIEMTEELAGEIGLKVDIDGFNVAFEKHQELSKQGAEQKFKGGLADNGEATTRLHTATHLLNASLKKILSPDINQKGSNITAERLRFDFNFDRKITDEELKQIENLVNEVIQAKLPIICEELTVEQAKEQGAVGVFDKKYGEKVKVYSMGDFSKEICGGPHASNTFELGHFRIVKEQSSSSGVRRIKAVLEN